VMSSASSAVTYTSVYTDSEPGRVFWGRESSASRKSTVIRLRIPQRRSTRHTLPTPIPTIDEADDIILQDTIQLSLAEQKIREELEANQNEDKVKEHLMAEEIEKLVEGTENVEENEVDSSTLRQINNQMIPTLEEEKSAEGDYELRRREKGSMFMPRNKFHELAQHLQEVMEESLPEVVDTRIKELTKTQVDSSVRNYMSGHILHNIAKRQKTSEHGTYVFGEFVLSCVRTMNRVEPGDEHQYHIDQMQNILKNDNVWESKEGNIVHHIHRSPLLKETSNEKFCDVSCTSLMQFLFRIMILKNEISVGPGKSKEVVYSNSKIVQIIKTYWELGHEHKFITKIIARRANGSIVSITESDYKNFNKNDIKDMYMLIVNGKLGVESYQQKVNLTAPTITFPSIEKYKMFSIVSKPVYGIIYKNNKKEKKVMRHQEVHKFCDVILKIVLKGLKSYNNNVKHGYVTLSLSKEDAEYLQLFEEEIEERLKHRDQEGNTQNN
ncbi:hypothetical protein Tco_0106049, partial [Tanacetum coccineum]